MWKALALGSLVACSVGKSPPAPSDDVAVGEETFLNICSKCHGQDGTGGLPMTPDGRRPRDFTDPLWQGSVTDAQIETTIRGGKSPMPAFQALLTPAQIRAVIGKIRRLRKETGR